MFVGVPWFCNFEVIFRFTAFLSCSRTPRHNDADEAQVRNVVRRTAVPRGRGIQHGTAFRPDHVGQEQHPSPDQLQEQQETVGAGEGVRQALQHGPGERQGDVDRAAEARQGQEEGQAREQGPVHFQDVPEGRLGYIGRPQSAGQHEVISEFERSVKRALPEYFYVLRASSLQYRAKVNASTLQPFTF